MKIAGILTYLVFILTAVLFESSAGAEPIEISIGVSDNLAPRIVKIMEQYPNVCEQDNLFSTEWLRTSVEFVIVCRAIRLGGLEATYSIQNYPNSARTLTELKKGTFMIMVDLPWGKYSKDENVYQSSAVLQFGDFIKGVYTRPDHTALLKVKTVEELREYTAVTSKTWFYDWDALERLKVKKVAVPRYRQMGKMVENGRADFLIAEFPGANDLSQYINGMRFIPVPGVKIALLGSRHVAVSKQFSHSRQVFEAVEAGLKIMDQRGLIKKAYRNIGFFNPKVEDWKILCCDEP